MMVAANTEFESPIIAEHVETLLATFGATASYFSGMDIECKVEFFAEHWKPLGAKFAAYPDHQCMTKKVLKSLIIDHAKKAIELLEAE